MKQLSNAFPCGLDGSFRRLSLQGFEFSEDLFDWVDVGRVGRQEQQVGFGRSDRGSNSFALVTAKVVQDDDVAWFERRHENLFDVFPEAFSVDRAIEHAGRVDAIDAQRRDEGHRRPMPVRNFGVEPPARCAPAAGRRHVGFGPCLVDADEASWIDPRLVLLPPDAAAGNVRPVLLAWQQTFF